MKRMWIGASFLFLATPALATPLSSTAPGQSDTWGTTIAQNTNPWGNGSGSTGGGWGQQGGGSLSFPAQGVICDSSANVCFNATGAAIADTEREFGRRARLALENNLINSPILEVTFADGRYCNFSMKGCWTNNQRSQLDPRLNPWLFGGNATAGAQPGQGTVIGGAGSSWGPGTGTSNPNLPSTSNARPPFTRTEQRGRCKWTNSGTTIYEGSCRYTILQNNRNGSRTLDFAMEGLPLSNPLRTMRFTASGNNPWSLSLPNGSTIAARSAVDATASRTSISMDWGTFNLGFTSYNQATTAQLNQAQQPIGANGQLQPSDSEALGQALGGLLQQLFGGK
jgi:hypothetical protein